MLDASITRDYEQLRNQAAYLPWDHHTRLAIRGDDRIKFLNSYCTNDLTQLSPGSGCEAFVPNSQGKVLGFVTIYCESDRLLIETTTGQAASLMAHFDRYILRAKVELSNETSEIKAFVVAGPTASTILQQGTCSDLPLETLGSRNLEWHGLPIWLASTRLLSAPAFLLACPAANVVALEKLLKQHVPCVASAAFEILRIESGTAWYGTDITSDNLPQELGIYARAISFRKGCYLGQETIARIDAMGHVNWHWTGFRFTTAACPSGVSELMMSDKLAARITSIAWSPRLRSWLGVGYVRRGLQKPGTELPCQSGSAVVTALPLTDP